MPETIGSPLKLTPQSETNKKSFLELVAEYERHAVRVSLGGGIKNIERLHAKGKLTARERIAKLIDADSTFLEIGLFTAEGFYEAEGGAPSAGVVTGIGKIHNRECVIVANDATVKAGAWFPLTAKKNLRAQEIAIENNIPVIYLVDSAGVFLPMQDEIFPDKEHFGRQFRNNAIMSAMGIVQIAAVMGPCVAGGAYLPIMSDEALIVKGTGSVFLAGPALVEAAIGEKVDVETLGGAVTHCEISGVTDYEMKNDDECLKTIRSLVSKISIAPKQTFNRVKSEKPKFSPEEIFTIMPVDRAKPYEMRQIIARLVDGSEVDEYKAGYGKSIITAYARIDGWAVGIVANERAVIKTKKGEMQIGGVIYSDSADKAARFIMNCNQRNIPLVFLQDVTGFMVGSRAEHGGIIKDGAKMVNAVANSVVPKFTFIIGNSYGAGNYAMCGKAYDPRFIFAWPTAKIAVMGGAQASKTMLSIKIESLKRHGETITEAKQQELLKEIAGRYESQTNPMYAAARLWVDGVVSPLATREIISRGIHIAQYAPEREFKVGVLQT